MSFTLIEMTPLLAAASAATAFTSTVVGVVEVGPGVCQVDLLNPPALHHVIEPITTFKIDCDYVTEHREPIQIEDPVLNMAGPKNEN